jgi:hypothetical protein
MNVFEGIIIKDMKAFIDTLTDEEVLGIVIFCRFKSFAREDEFKFRKLEKKPIMDSLVKKGVLGKNGYVIPLTKEIYDYIYRNNILQKISDKQKEKRKEIAPLSDLKARVKDLL